MVKQDDKLKEDFSISVHLKALGVEEYDIPVIRHILKSDWWKFDASDLSSVRYNGSDDKCLVLSFGTERKYLSRSAIETIRKSPTYTGDSAMVTKGEDWPVKFYVSEKDFSILKKEGKERYNGEDEKDMGSA